jgi:hypothetical protein
MSWEFDPLFTKSKLFFERAFSHREDDLLFGLWCSLGLELLARAALASVSPTLLAEPNSDHKHLLYALNRGSKEVERRSIKAVQALSLCKHLFADFTADDLINAKALVNRRNEELHTGASAFDQYPSKLWLPGFYRACHSLVKAVGQTLENLFGADEAKVAAEILADTEKEVKKRVLDSISEHKKLFCSKPAEEREALTKSAKAETDLLVYRRHHRVACPACNSDATVTGREFGPQQVSNEDDEIVVRQSVSPRSFSCSACGLKLQGYAELHAADLGGHYTRRTVFSPEDYYGLIDPEGEDMSQYVQEYLADMAGEYDNE